ncbi:unnamed protein product [Peronospora belbahrii]|uniref:Uncharacterized protein n=1 Tax=Peronospora belbahrii TaxID=622444 RepID=A0ABN8D0J6_9STRA|nr:unnamed protein product [Peronospora belbahrii]
MHLYTIQCEAVSSIGSTRSVCDYTATNLYVVNGTVTSTPSSFPTGYVSCLNATGSDAELCKTCSCRENKVGLVEGVTVVGVICVGSGNATTCRGQDQEYCDCNGSAGCTVNNTVLQDGSSFDEDMSGSNYVSVSSNDSRANGSDTSVESNSVLSPSTLSNFTAESAVDYIPSTTDTNPNLNTNVSISIESSSSDADINTNKPTSIPVIGPELMTSSSDSHSGSAGIDEIDIPVIASESASSTIDTENGSSILDVDIGSDSASGSADSSNAVNSSTDTTVSLHTNVDADTSSNGTTVKPASSSYDFGSDPTGFSIDKDNVVGNVDETTKPSQLDTAPSTDQNTIRSRDNGSTTFGTSTSSSNSSWSGERLTAVLSAMCGIGITAAIAIFVVMRRSQFIKDKELGTPMDDYPDDNTSMAMPTNYGKQDVRYYSKETCKAEAFDETPLASIDVIGSDDSFLTPPPSPSKRQYRSYRRTASKDSYECSVRPVAGKDVAMQDSRSSYATIQQQFLASHNKDVQSPTSSRIFDTRESYSSGMSSQCDIPSDERMYESATSFKSFRTPLDASCGTHCDSNSSRNLSNRQALSKPESEENVAVSSFSSQESVQYAIRDTEASERMHESEMMKLSCIAFSFDMDSI